MILILILLLGFGLWALVFGLCALIAGVFVFGFWFGSVFLAFFQSRGGSLAGRSLVDIIGVFFSFLGLSRVCFGKTAFSLFFFFVFFFLAVLVVFIFLCN